MKSDRKRYRVRPMNPREAEAVARLHKEGIPTGVLADLGVTFMKRLYRAIPEADGFVFVAVDQHDNVVGFVSGSANLAAAYRCILTRRFFSLSVVAAKAVLNLRMLRRVWNTLRYPASLRKDLPSAELLSIVLDPSAHGAGAATQLLEALLNEFNRRGVYEIKVMVRADFYRANGFYKKHGFKLADEISSHGHLCYVYTINTR